MYTIIAKKTFTTELVKEGSFGCIPVGTHESTMALMLFEDGRIGIEWDIPDLDESYGIGLEVCGKAVTGYDGVMSLPAEAVELLEENGYDCSE